MAGLTVDKYLLDQRTSEAVLAVRDAFAKVEVISDWLSDNPSELLVAPVEEGGFGYTEEESYLIRTTFQNLHALNVQPLLDIARKLTGLN